MGRITLFSVEDCVHCTRLTNALIELDIPYTEISLSTHPQRRCDMLSLTDRLTLPQTFFNERHIGGADETIKVLENWFTKTTTSKKTVQDHYLEEVGSLPDPTDQRLRISTEPPVEPKKALIRPSTDRIQLPSSSSGDDDDNRNINSNNNSVSVLVMMENLRQILPCATNKTKTKLAKQTFTGAQAVQAFQKEYNINEKEAIEFGEYLRQALIFHSVIENVVEFMPHPKCLYRLQCYSTPEVLNSYRVWNTVVDSDYMSLLHRLKRSLDKIEKEITTTTATTLTTQNHDQSTNKLGTDDDDDDDDEKTSEVNYTLVKSNKNFPIFEEAVCELQRVDLTKLDTKTVLAFGINCYNLFIKYAFFKLGVTNSSRSRSAFFNGVKFNVGNEIYSFQDWEHGFLRGNRKAPFSIKPQFSSKDPRLACCSLLPEVVDCRIHFALNCGAKSCPPMRTFTADGIEEELRIVSLAFCEDDDNVEVDVKRRCLSLNKILSWYRVDFASSERELPTKILEFLRGEKRAQLQQLLDKGKPIHVTYKKYDWSTNASDYVAFDSAILRADIQRFGARFKFGGRSVSSKVQ